MNADNESQSLNRFIGKKIAEYRLKKGFSQSELAKRIGKPTPTAISYFENGDRKVSIEDLIKIANVLGKSIDDFLPPRNSSNNVSNTESKDFALKLRSSYKKLDKKTQESILDFAELARKKFRKDGR